MDKAFILDSLNFVSHNSFQKFSSNPKTINFQQEITRPLQLATFVLTLSMGWLFLSAYQLLETQTELSKIDSFRFDLISFQRSIVDAETGQRGYLITNNPTFLSPYENNVLRTKYLLANLENYRMDLPDLALKLQLLKEYSEEKFRIIDASVQVQLHAGAYASHLTLSKDKGRLVMENIDAIVKDMDSWLVNAKSSISNNSHRILSQVILCSIFLVIIISGILLFSYRRTVYLFEHAIENRIQSELLGFEADHDPLTKLPNRRKLNTHLKNIHSLSRRMEDLYAVFYMDLDGFKGVNDKLGHDAGDLALIKASQRFTRVLRDTDFLARMGGDEFVLVVHRYKDDKELTTLSQRILNSFIAPIEYKHNYSHIGVSIGIARYPANGKTLDNILQAADKAMYESKLSGKGRYSFAQL